MEFHPLAKCCHLMSIASGRKSWIGLGRLGAGFEEHFIFGHGERNGVERFSFTPPSPA